MSATEEILNLIASAVDSTGHGGASALLSVGVVDGRAKSELQSVIENALNHRERKYDNPRNEENRNIEEHIRLIKEENKQDEERIKKAQKILQDITDPVKIFDTTLNKTIKQFGPFGEALGVATTALKMFIDHQFKWLERYRQLNDVGVTLNGSLGSLADRATAAGLRIDEYTELVKSHSTAVAKLGGLYGDGIKTFTTLIKNNKELGYQLGMMPQQVAKISAAFAGNSELLFNRNETMATLTTKTQEYIIWLDKLSKATGKSREQVLEETKARENDLRLKVLTKNEVNKKRLDMLMAINPNLTTEDQIAFLSGRMTGNLGMMQNIPYVGNILNQLAQARSNEDFSNIINTYQPIMKQMAQDMYGEMQIQAGLMKPEIFSNIYGSIENLANFNENGFNQGGKKTAEGETNRNLRLLNEQLNRFTNEISKGFLMSPDKMVKVTDMLLKYIPIIATTTSAILTAVAVKSVWNLRNKRFHIGDFSFYNMNDARRMGQKYISNPIGKYWRGMTSTNRELGAYMNYGANYGQDKLDEYMKRYRRFRMYKVKSDMWNATGGRMVNGLMSGMRRFGGTAIGGIIRNVGTWFGRLLTRTIPHLLKFGFKMVPIVGWIWTLLEAIIFAIKNRNIIAKWTGKIAGMLSRAIVGIFKSLWNTIVSVAKVIGNFIAHPIDSIKKLASGTGDFFENLSEGFKEGYYGKKEESSNDLEDSNEEYTTYNNSMDNNLSYNSPQMEYNNTNNYRREEIREQPQEQKTSKPSTAVSALTQLSDNISKVSVSLNSNNDKLLSSINTLVDYAKKISEYTSILKEYEKNNKEKSNKKGNIFSKYISKLVEPNNKNLDNIFVPESEEDVKNLLESRKEKLNKILDAYNADLEGNYTSKDTYWFDPKTKFYSIGSKYSHNFSGDLSKANEDHRKRIDLMKKLGVTYDTVSEFRDSIQENMKTRDDWHKVYRMFESIKHVNGRIGFAFDEIAKDDVIDSRDLFHLSKGKNNKFKPEEYLKKYFPVMYQIYKLNDPNYDPEKDSDIKLPNSNDALTIPPHLLQGLQKSSDILSLTPNDVLNMNNASVIPAASVSNAIQNPQNMFSLNQLQSSYNSNNNGDQLNKIDDLIDSISKLQKSVNENNEALNGILQNTYETARNTKEIALNGDNLGE